MCKSALETDAENKCTYTKEDRGWREELGDWD